MGAVGVQGVCDGMGRKCEGVGYVWGSGKCEGVGSVEDLGVMVMCGVCGECGGIGYVWGCRV